MKELIVMSFVMSFIMFTIVSCAKDKADFYENQKKVIGLNPGLFKTHVKEESVIELTMRRNTAEIILEMDLETGNKEIIATARRTLDEAESDLDEGLESNSVSLVE